MANILAEVIKTRDAVTGEEVRDLMENVERNLTQMKTDLVESMQSNFVLFDSDIDKVTSWYVEILGVKEKVDDLKQKFYDDRKALKAATDDFESLEGQIEHCDNEIVLLETLVKIVRNVEKADTADFYKASELFRGAQEQFHFLLEQFPSAEDHSWIVSLRSTLEDLVADIYEKVSKELRSVLQFHFGKSKLVVDLSKDITPLMNTLENIDYSTRMMQKIAADVWQELLVKACSVDYYVEVTGQPKSPGSDQRYIKQEDIERRPTRLIAQAVKNAQPTSRVEVVFTSIYNVLSVLKDTFHQYPKVMSDFASYLGPKICEELSTKCLRNLVLRSAEGNRTKAIENVAVIQDFISRFATKLGFEFRDTSVFDELERDFDAQFVTQVRLDLVAKVRRLVKANIHDTQEVKSESVVEQLPEDGATLHRNPAAFPKCVVSKSVVEIVDTLKDHLRKYKDDTSVCEAALDLYLSLVKVPKHESEGGDLVPLSAVLIHNNSHFLAHHAAFTLRISEDKIPELRSKATQAYSFMMRSVRTKLNAMISDAVTAILNNDDEASVLEINNFLKIASEFVRLHGMLDMMLTSATLARTLATLVDHTVNEMCSKILACDDISAACANKLATAFTQFAVETSDIFKGDATNPREIEAVTSKYVHKWNRFRLLTFVLTASMKEIEDKWVEGCGPLAMEFKAEELRKLVRALFQNTDRRAAFLATIK